MLSWWDGKKTIIAAALLTVSAFITQILLGVWHVEWPWLPNVVTTLEWVGMILGGTGLAHKAFKANRE